MHLNGTEVSTRVGDVRCFVVEKQHLVVAIIADWSVLKTAIAATWRGGRESVRG